MNEFNTYEYSVEHSKKDKKLRLKRTLLIIGYVVYCVALISVVAFIPVGVLVAPLMAFVPVTCWIIYHFTWRYVKPEYQYSMTSGTLTFSILFGGKSKKKQFETKIAAAEAIAPYTEDAKLDIEKYAPQVTYYGVSAFDSPDAYYMLFTDESGNRCVYYFEATERALKVLRFYNSKTVVTKVRY